MKDYTSDNPVFSDKIPIVERADLVNWENKTKSEKQLLQNDLVLRARLKQCLGDDPKHGDSQNLIVTFDSGDCETANKWTDTETIHSGEEHKNLMAKVSTMVKNVRYLYKLLGTTDISKMGDGTVTGAIKKVNKALKPIDTENRVENMTSINQITSIGFWKISAIDSNYASSIGIDNNTGDFYAIVSNYNGNGTDHFNFGDLLLFSPRLQSYHYEINVWNGDARARLVLTNDNILTTKEQINANTDPRNVAGATAMKEMFGQINSNLAGKANAGLPVNPGDDCNNLGFGVFLCNAGTANIPYDNWWLILSANISGTAVQVAFMLFGTDIYKRYCAAGNWSEWAQYTNGFKATIIDLSYKSATEMFYEFDNNWINPVSLVILNHPQTPIEYVTSTSVARVDGKVKCCAYGNGFVNGHILRAKLCYFD